MGIHIGTSGWVYPHWRGKFYPGSLPQKEWFNYYAGEFETVEINNSFYRLPTANAFDQWRKQSPRGFVYAVKASRYLTHMKKLKDPKDPLKRFFTVADHLRKRLGPVLYQLPPHWTVDVERFSRFLNALPSGYKHVIEFRDPSWLIEEIFDLMEKHRVTHCIHDFQKLKVPIRITSRVVYVRLHGDRSHRGNYSRAKLKTWAKRIDQWRRDKKDIYVYFNNDLKGYAIKNALTLRQMVE
jgi:uncharacterized protein YecE (DUF72 family)